MEQEFQLANKGKFAKRGRKAAALGSVMSAAAQAKQAGTLKVPVSSFHLVPTRVYSLYVGKLSSGPICSGAICL